MNKSKVLLIGSATVVCWRIHRAVPGILAPTDLETEEQIMSKHEFNTSKEVMAKTTNI